MQYKKNKGEWSEFYVLLKILVDKILQGADEDLNLLSEPVYPVQKVIISKDASSQTDYTFSGELIEVRHPYSSDSTVAVVNTESLRPKVREVFEAIKGSQDTTFEIPEVEDLIRDLRVESIQGSSSNKTDISVVLHDAVTQTQQEVGFSIKSQIGSPSTLLNASGATNFIYDTGLTGQDALEKINNHESLNAKIQEIIKLGGSLSFIKTNNRVFETNLRTIDTILPEILAEVVKIHYVSKLSLLDDVTQALSINDPLPEYTPNYVFKVKSLLKAVALGMMPSKEWDGLLEANGGYIIVRTDGEIACYNVYHADAFMSYLLNNTKLETPSRSKHGFGTAYLDEGRIYIKLNLQIRFIK